MDDLDYIEYSGDPEYDEDELYHIGIKRRSGRYPWGSGKDPLQRANNYRKFIGDLEKQGLSQTQIVNHINSVYKLERHERLSTTDLRAGTTIATDVIRTDNIMRAQKLRADRQMSPSAIAQRMSTPDKIINESTVRGWLSAYDKGQKSSLQAVVDVLKAQNESKPFLDVGAGTELHMGISDVRLKAALVALKDEVTTFGTLRVHSWVPTNSRHIVSSLRGMLIGTLLGKTSITFRTLRPTSPRAVRNSLFLDRSRYLLIRSESRSALMNRVEPRWMASFN